MENELSCFRCRIPSYPSRIRQVTCGSFLKSWGRLLAYIIISNHSTIRICILRRGGSFSLLWVIAERLASSVFKRNLHPQLCRSRLHFLHLRAICLLLLRIPTTCGRRRLPDNLSQQQSVLLREMLNNELFYCMVSFLSARGELKKWWWS